MLQKQCEEGGPVFPRFHFSRKYGFHCFPATNNKHHKELFDLHVEKYELILYYIFEESVVHYLKWGRKFCGKPTI